MKTLHLTNAWHETSGGIATFYRALMAEADRRKQQIRLVVPGENDHVEEIGQFARIYYIQSPRSLFNRRYRSIYPGQYLSAGSKLQVILRTERPDLVEICDKYTLNYLGPVLRRQLSSTLDFRPVVVGLSCERMDDNFRTYIGRMPLARAFCSAYMKWVYFPFFDHHIANSEYTAEELWSASRGHLVARGTWVRHMGVDLAHLSRQRRSNEARGLLLQRSGGGKDSVLLLYVGRLVPEKNLGLLFGLMANLSQNKGRDFRLLVAGDGIEHGKWQEQTACDAPGRVHFLGHLTDRELLADLYANSDVFIHPNPHEPFGIAPLEAMASGLPLIAPDSGGVTSYANQSNAWLAPPNVVEFAAALDRALTDAEERRSRVSAALETARRFDWTTVAASFLDLYNELHRSALSASEPSPAPAFYSTPAVGSNSVAVRSIARLAERTFKLLHSRRTAAEAMNSRAGSHA